MQKEAALMQRQTACETAFTKCAGPLAYNDAMAVQTANGRHERDASYVSRLEPQGHK
jgi:hypothetical protein